MAPPIRIVIADHDAESRGALTAQLSEHADVSVVGTAANGDEAVALAERLAPDLVLFDTDLPGLDGIAATERLAARLPPIAVILMGGQDEPAAWRRAMLAGARDFLARPVGGEDLLASVRQVHAAQQRERERLSQAPVQVPSPNGHVVPGDRGSGPGKIVALFSPKGGVGRTTLAVNLATAAVGSGRDICLVDASLQFGDVAIMLDLNPNLGSIMDYVGDTGRRPGESSDPGLVSHSSGLRVLLAPPSPEVAELVQPEHIRSTLETLAASHDLVVVDTSSWFSEDTLAVLDVADVILAVMTLEITNLKNMRLFLQLAEGLGYSHKVELVLNRSDAMLGIELPEAEQTLGRKIDHSVVSDGRTVVYALNRGVPFTIANPETPVSRDVKRLAEHLLSADVPTREEPVEPPRRRRSLLAWR
jgi:pilus assembly protein CpaE